MGSKVVFRQMLSSVKRLSSNVVFRQRSSSIKCRLLSKVVFRQRSSSVKAHLPSNVVFRQRSSSVTGHLPSNVFFHQRSSSANTYSLQCLHSCQYTSSIPDLVVLTVYVVCTHVLYTVCDCTVVSEVNQAIMSLVV